MIAPPFELRRRDRRLVRSLGILENVPGQQEVAEDLYQHERLTGQWEVRL